MAAKRPRKIKMVPHVSEDVIQKAVAAHLNVRVRPNVYWFHVPNGGKRNLIEAVKLKAMGTKAGVPDLFFLKAGRTFFLELKTRRGKLSPEQKVAKELIEMAGGTWAIAKGIDEALDQLARWGIFAGGRTT